MSMTGPAQSAVPITLYRGLARLARKFDGAPALKALLSLPASSRYCHEREYQRQAEERLHIKMSQGCPAELSWQRVGQCVFVSEPAPVPRAAKLLSLAQPHSCNGSAPSRA